MPVPAHAIQCIHILSRCKVCIYVHNVYVQPHWDHTLLLDSSLLDTLVCVLCVCTAVHLWVVWVGVLSLPMRQYHCTVLLYWQRFEEDKHSLEGEPHAVKGSRLKTSASDSKLVRSRGRAKLEVTDDLGVHCEEEEPEFYRSDLLSVLKEKTNYMTLYFDAEDEIALLREQFRRCDDHYCMHACLHMVSLTGLTC